MWLLDKTLSKLGFYQKMLVKSMCRKKPTDKEPVLPEIGSLGLLSLCFVREESRDILVGYLFQGNEQVRIIPHSPRTTSASRGFDASGQTPSFLPPGQQTEVTLRYLFMQRLYITLKTMKRILTCVS